MDNPRGQVNQLLDALGFRHHEHLEVQEAQVAEQRFVVTVVLRLPGRPPMRVKSDPTLGKKKATQLAFSGILERLRAEDAESAVAWEQVAQDAQAGDALIKLAAYLNPELKTAEQSSRWLQEQESDAHLVGIYDRLEAQGEPSLERWGSHLSVKRKATLVEALIWRRFGSAVLAPGARAELADIVTLLTED